ncbi:MAG TPA: hypothetical protein VIH96_17335 [Paraburkholderia sp.]
MSDFPDFPNLGTPPLGADFFSLHGFMDETQKTVSDMLGIAHDKADSAVKTANDAIAALKDAKWPDPLPDPPPAPAPLVLPPSSGLGTGFLPTPNFGDITQGVPDPLLLPPVDIPDITTMIPTYVPVITGLSFIDPPPLVLPTLPTAPEISTDFTIPNAPVAAYGDLPPLAPVALPSFTPPVLPLFDEPAPTFTGTPPDPFLDWTEPVYTSALGTAVIGVMQTMLAGGTGLAPDVERAIWERARMREDQIGLKAVREAADEFAARGFTLPPGMLQGAILAALDENNKKISSLSRDVAIKQAELEQGNRQFAVKSAIEYEGLMVNVFLAVTNRNFEIAKFSVEASIQVYNARIAGFNVEQQIYAQRIERFKTMLQAALAQIEAYKATVDAQRLVSEVNKSVIESYVAKVNAFNVQVEAYKALVQASVARAEQQKLKIELYKGEIDGYVGIVSAKKAEFDTYVARIEGESSKAKLEEANAHAYGARVEAIKTINDAYVKTAEAKIENNKGLVALAVANMDRLRTLAQQQLTLVQANATVWEAETRRATAVLEAQKSIKQLEVTTVVEANRNVIARYEAQIHAYVARTQEIIEMAKINASSLQAIGTIASNIAAGALAGTHVGAQLGASGSAGENKSAQTSSGKMINQSTNANSNYSINHQYNHDVA